MKGDCIFESAADTSIRSCPIACRTFIALTLAENEYYPDLKPSRRLINLVLCPCWNWPVLDCLQNCCVLVKVSRRNHDLKHGQRERQRSSRAILMYM